MDTPGVQGKGSERVRWCIGGAVVGERPGDEEARLLVYHSLHTFHLRRSYGEELYFLSLGRDIAVCT